MADSPFIELLSKQPAARLREMLVQYDEAVERITFERRYVEEALRLKSAQAQPSEKPTASKSATRKPAAKSPRGDGGGKRDVIRRIMETRPGEIWLPSGVRDAMHAQGTETNAASVRAVMKRMLDEGELERPGEGEHGFRLAVAEPRFPGIGTNGAGNGSEAPHSSGDSSQRGQDAS